MQIDPWPAGSFGVAARGRAPHQPLHLVPARRRRPTTATRARSRACIAFVDSGAGEVLEVVDLGVVPMPPERGLVPARTTSGRCATDLKPLEIVQPDGPSFTVDGNLVQLAALVVPGRLRSLRGARAAHRRLPRRRPRAAGAAPRVDHARWSCPYGDPGADARLEERVRRRRVGPRSHGELAEARLRLPRRDPLLRRRARDRAGRRRTPSSTRSACTRRTTGSSGSTTTCTAAPTRCAARAASSSASSPPSATTSTASTGTSTSTATSSSR